MIVQVPSADELSPLSPAELDALPVFPLPKMVFFPGSALPLHLFEPRYRQMILDCTTGGPKAMAVTLLLPGYEEDYEGQPPIATVSGVGRIVWHEALPDGRHDIVLVGLGRARLDELPMDGRPYRRAKATMLPDRGDATGADVSGLLSCASAISAAVRDTHPEFSLGLDEKATPGQVADAIADRLVADSRERQAILETLDVHRRIDRVTAALSELLAEIQLARDEGTVH
jgi:Lon protease-like protein